MNRNNLNFVCNNVKGLQGKDKRTKFLNTLRIASLQMGLCSYKRLIPV